MESRIRALIEPIAEELGIDVLKISMGGDRTPLLRIIVDRAGGIDCDGLERISRALSLQLDVEDFIDGQFRLEVTSPGLDWPLTNEADFIRYKGEWIKADLIDGHVLEGENMGPAGDGFVLKSSDGKSHSLAMDEVHKVVRAVNWKEISRKQKKRKK